MLVVGMRKWQLWELWELLWTCWHFRQLRTLIHDNHIDLTIETAFAILVMFWIACESTFVVSSPSLIDKRHAMLVNDVNGWVGGGGGRVPFWLLGEWGREVVGFVARFHIVFVEICIGMGRNRPFSTSLGLTCPQELTHCQWRKSPVLSRCIEEGR